MNLIADLDFDRVISRECIFYGISSGNDTRIKNMFDIETKLAI